MIESTIYMVAYSSLTLGLTVIQGFKTFQVKSSKKMHFSPLLGSAKSNHKFISSNFDCEKDKTRGIG